MGIFVTKAFAPSIEINDEKSFSLQAITGLQLDMTKEKIHILQSQTSEVRLHYHGTSKQELKLSAETSDGMVVVKSTRKTNMMLEDLYLDVYLPEDYGKQIIIHTSSGDVAAETVKAQKISVITTSGSITLNDCAGSLDLKATSGNISAAYKVFTEHSINIATTSGSIQLQIPGTAEFSLEAKTSTGKLQSEFPVNMDGNKKMIGQIGTKSNKIVLQTSTGGINLLKK